jgi:hypothetical protein
LPTPLASMAKGSSRNALTRRSGESRAMVRLDHYVMAKDGGPVNPEWAEWLMAWPPGWTDSAPLETDRFQSWLQQLSEPFRSKQPCERAAPKYSPAHSHASPT